MIKSESLHNLDRDLPSNSSKLFRSKSLSNFFKFEINLLWFKKNKLKRSVSNNFLNTINENQFKSNLKRCNSLNSFLNKNLDFDNSIKPNFYLEILKNESFRLKTFMNWDLDFIEPMDLAQSGFFYLNTSDNVQCIFCQLKLWNWTSNDIPILEHYKHSPKCVFINGYNCNNISKTNFNPTVALKTFIGDKYEFQGLKSQPNLDQPFEDLENKFILKFDSVNLEKDEKLDLQFYKPKIEDENLVNNLFTKMKDEKTRLKTFSLNTWPIDFINPFELSRAGFFYSGKEDKVICAFCKIIIWGWEPCDNPIREHYLKNPNCPYLIYNEDEDKQSLFSLNLSEDVSPSSVSNGSVTNDDSLDLSIYEDRLLTFKGWPFSNPSQESLALAGFYFTGLSDCVKCYSCNIDLCDWQPQDNPWTEHMKFNDECPFLSSLNQNGQCPKNSNLKVHLERLCSGSTASSLSPIGSDLESDL